MPTRRSIVALLLATFGLISACGAGLHQLVDGSTPRIEAGANPGSPDPGPASWDHGHADCSICHALGQSLLATAETPTVALGDLRGATPPPESTLDRTPPRRRAAPRAPPIVRA